MKYLDNLGLSYFYSKLLARAKITETKYRYVTVSAGEVVSFTIPNFSSLKTVEVFINGLVCIEGYDYSIANNIVTLANDLDAGQVVYFVVREVSL